MFKKTIEALKSAEAAAQKELDALFVPYDPETGGGGVHWNATGSSVLQSVLSGVRDLLRQVEPRQVAHEKATAEAEAAASAAAAEVDATPAALEHAESLGVDITQIKGTGKDGKVTKSDVEAAVAAKEGTPA